MSGECLRSCSPACSDRRRREPPGADHRRVAWEMQESPMDEPVQATFAPPRCTSARAAVSIRTGSDGELHSLARRSGLVPARCRALGHVQQERVIPWGRPELSIGAGHVERSGARERPVFGDGAFGTLGVTESEPSKPAPAQTPARYADRVRAVSDTHSTTASDRDGIERFRDAGPAAIRRRVHVPRWPGVPYVASTRRRE